MQPSCQRPALARRLIEQQVIEPELLDHALADARRLGRPLIRHLLNEALAPAAGLARAAATEFGLPLIHANELKPQPAATERIDAQLIRRHHALPIRLKTNRLTVAISDPANVAAIDEIRFQSGLPVDPVLAQDDELAEQIAKTLGPVDHDLQQASQAVSAREQPITELDDEDTPVVRFINRTLMEAVTEQASDIHFEPFEHHCRVRFRRDGMLREVAQAPAGIAPRLSARIKVLARLDIAERRVPQDGRLRFPTGDGEHVDFRVSSCPTLFGEKLVLRLLNPDTAARTLQTLGLSAEQLAAYRQAIDQPHGMILVTGPTGSGKTVTLYSALAALNTAERNVLSVEDPVEIDLPGINQVSINPRAGLDFPSTLRAFLRQDPDVMMVGEIRDQETAEITVKAAQTGHLVLSTLHTNSAPAAITRLANMGIAPWNIAASVSLIMAQRLVRRLCPHCCEPAKPSQTQLQSLGFDPSLSSDVTFYEALGCSACVNGYDGRIGIHEVLPVSQAITQLILDGASLSAITEQARETGIANLKHSGRNALLQGLTSVAEIHRMIA